MFDGEIRLVRLLMEDTINYTLSFLFEKDQKEGIITIKPLRPTKDFLESITNDQIVVSNENDIYSYKNVIQNNVPHSTITTIYPATHRHISKMDLEAANLGGKRKLIREDYETYKNVVLPWILRDELDWNGRLKWIQNIFSGQKESDLVIKDVKDYIILPDSKWNRHNTETTYLLLLFKDISLHSIRDLNISHLSLLKEISSYIHSSSLFVDLMNSGIVDTNNKQPIESLSSPSFRAYFHYLPSYFQLHLHITHVDMGLWNAQVGQSILLEDLIDLLETSNNFKERTMNYYLSPTHSIYHLL